MSAAPGWVVLIPGNRWHDVAGTDHHLARALGRRGPVLWVDPPFSAARILRPADRPDRDLREVAPGVHRLQLVVPPGPSRPVLRRIARALVRRRLEQTVRGQLSVRGVVLTSAQAEFPAVDGRRLLFVSDDWVAGAAMMGLSQAAVRQGLERTLAAAEVVTAVSPELARSVAGWSRQPRTVQVVPNGVEVLGMVSTADRIGAGLVGQLNERLDVSVLHAVLDRGVPLRVVGPLTARDPGSRAALERLLSRPEITWAGRVPVEQLPSELSRFRVGLTPYLDNTFNRASFPLKTLEYLGAGLPVVSSDLPSTRWLDSPDVEVVADPADFADRVAELASAPSDPRQAARRVEFARQHSWDARAEELLRLLG